MPELGADPALAHIQTYVRQPEDERGFTNTTIEQSALLLGEEIGELFKAPRKHQNMPVDGANSRVDEVEGELADVLIFVCALANRGRRPRNGVAGQGRSQPTTRGADQTAELIATNPQEGIVARTGGLFVAV